MRYLFASLVFVLATSLALANEPEQAPGYCQVAQARIGGMLVEWVGYPTGWVLPDDLKITDIFRYPQDGGLVTYHSDNENANYYFDFWSWRVSGEPLGQHDFCGPYKVILSDEH